MPTKNLGLPLISNASESSIRFSDWRRSINGDGDTSLVKLLDDFAGVVIRDYLKSTDASQTYMKTEDADKFFVKADDNGIATKTYVASKIQELVNSAPESLDTLKELSDALGGDSNFSTTVLNLVGTKLSIDQGVDNVGKILVVDTNGHLILGDPDDVCTLTKYVTQEWVAAYVEEKIGSVVNAPNGMIYDNVNEDKEPVEVTLYGSIIPSYLVANRPSVTKINFRDNVTELSSYSITKCNAIEVIALPDNIQVLGSNCISDNAELTRIEFEGNVDSIAEDAFTDNPNITDIYVPWDVGEVPGAPWGATDAKISYLTVVINNGEITNSVINDGGGQTIIIE